jgi:hypothetical protein
MRVWDVPWLVPGRYTSWVPLPWLCISRHWARTSGWHKWHEYGHALQIERDGWWATVWRAWRERRAEHGDRTYEREANEYAAAMVVGEPHPLEGWE